MPQDAVGAASLQRDLNVFRAIALIRRIQIALFEGGYRAESVVAEARHKVWYPLPIHSGLAAMSTTSPNPLSLAAPLSEEELDELDRFLLSDITSELLSKIRSSLAFMIRRRVGSCQTVFIPDTENNKAYLLDQWGA